MTRRHQRSGFSLIELLVSCIILSIALIAFGQLFLAGYLTMEKARYLSLATIRAENEIERLSFIEYDSMLNGPSITDYPTAVEGGTYQHFFNEDGTRGVRFPVEDLPGGQGELSWRRSSLAGISDTNLLEVVVRITWDAQQRLQSDVVVSTLLVNR